jgi:hypothetical protein
MKTNDRELLAKANALLDQVKAGHYVKPWLITQALRLTGDLERNTSDPKRGEARVSPPGGE